MIQMEAKLSRGVKASQVARLSDIDSKLAFDDRSAGSLQDKLRYETLQEKKLALEMSKIVNHEQEVKQAQKVAAAKDAQLQSVTQELDGVKDKLADCNKGPFRFKAC